MLGEADFDRRGGQMTDQIERELVLPAPPEKVWELITGCGFLADDVELDLTPGGEAHFDEKVGWVEEALPASRLAFWWGTDGEPATRVELTLEPEGENQTRLRVVESRPLELLDVVGIPLPGSGGPAHGPAMVAAL
jgi:uncharacterized protein YndB with AHSA1/START domain